MSHLQQLLNYCREMERVCPVPSSKLGCPAAAETNMVYQILSRTSSAACCGLLAVLRSFNRACSCSCGLPSSRHENNHFIKSTGVHVAKSSSCITKVSPRSSGQSPCCLLYT